MMRWNINKALNGQLQMHLWLKLSRVWNDAIIWRRRTSARLVESWTECCLEHICLMTAKSGKKNPKKYPTLFFISLCLFSEDQQWTLIAVIIEFHSFIFRQTHTLTNRPPGYLRLSENKRHKDGVSHRNYTPNLWHLPHFPSNCCPPHLLSITPSPRSPAPPSLPTSLPLACHRAAFEELGALTRALIGCHHALRNVKPPPRYNHVYMAAAGARPPGLSLVHLFRK